MTQQYTRPPGMTTIAPEVLVTICSLAALGVDGVSRLATVPGSVSKLFKKEIYDGVKVEIENSAVYADIFVILNRGTDVREVCRSIQSQVARSISEMVGMEVGRVNVHVEDVDYQNE